MIAALVSGSTNEVPRASSIAPLAESFAGLMVSLLELFIAEAADSTSSYVMLMLGMTTHFLLVKVSSG
ncbi:hypothetical protein GCM10022227_16110 [Streptomyces sedi]